jgi:hypothetical protein
MDHNRALTEGRMASPKEADPTTGPPPNTVLELPSITRFLIGSTLLMTGCMLVLSAAITVVGLPVGLMVLAAGLELMRAPSDRPTRARS